MQYLHPNGLSTSYDEEAESAVVAAVCRADITVETLMSAADESCGNPLLASPVKSECDVMDRSQALYSVM